MTRNELDLLWQIEIHCGRCIRSCMYFFASSGSKSGNLWRFTQNCYGYVAIMHWCNVFGSYSEPTHYQNFFKDKCFNLSDGTKIDLNSIKKRLRDSCGLSEDDYQDLWREVKDARDSFFAHNEFSRVNRPRFPDLGKLQKTCLEMREIVYAVLSPEECSEDPNYYQNFLDYLERNGNKEYSLELEEDCQILKNTIK